MPKAKPAHFVNFTKGTLRDLSGEPGNFIA